MSFLAPFSYLQCHKIINAYGKTNLIVSTLSSPIHYLHSAYCQFFFTTIEHFPARASFEKKTLMHHAAIINNLCLENSGIILYSKAECSFIH